MLTVYNLTFSICFFFYKTFQVYHTSVPTEVSQHSRDLFFFVCFFHWCHILMEGFFMFTIYIFRFLGKRTNENEGSVPSESYCNQDFGSKWLGSPLCTKPLVFLIKNLLLTLHAFQAASISSLSSRIWRPINMLSLILASFFLRKITLKYWKHGLLCCSVIVNSKLGQVSLPLLSYRLWIIH